MKLEMINLNEICRTCKCVSPQMQSLFERYNNPHQSSRFDEMLMACASVQVMCGDGLPEQICQICLEQLKNAFLFKRQCEKIDAVLREYAKSVKVNEIKQELQNSDFIESLNTLNNLLNEESTSKSTHQDVEISSVVAESETDYIQFLDNNQMLLTCRECAKIFTTLEGLRCHKLIHSSKNLGILEDRYHHVDRDAETIHDCFESQVEVTESMDDERVKEVVDIGRNVEVSNVRNVLIRGGSDKDNETESSFDKTVENLPNEKMGGNDEVKVEELMEDSFPEEEDHLIDMIHVGRETPPTKGMEEKAIENKKFLCPFCQEVFNTLSSLDRHARMKHDGLKVHKCNVCNKEFRRASHLKQHLQLHERSYDFECDRCPTAFNRADRLSKHKASKHGVVDKKTHPLLVCSSPNGQEVHQSKPLLSDSHLAEHMKSNRKRPKKFFCTECDQKFVRNDYLVIHMRRHRGEKPFKCKYCGKGFARMTDLTVHERCHTGEKTHLCTICGKGFGRAYNLTVHMRTHTGEKPYQCTYCDVAFAQSNDLKTHVRRHTGERFECELCSDKFLMGYLLTQHKRTVHGLNIVSNRMQPLQKQGNPDEPAAVTLPEPLVPENEMSDEIHESR